MSRMSPGFLGLWDGMDRGIRALTVGCSGRVQDVPGLPRTLEWIDSGIRALHSGTLGTCPGCPWASWDSGMRWTGGLEPSTVGRLGHVWDVPGIPGTLGWDGQWDCRHLEWDTRDMSGMSLGFQGLLDGMDSGIEAFYSGTLGTCPGCPWASRDSRMGWKVGLEPSTARDMSGMSLGFPGTLGWDGQWDWSHLEWDTRDMSGMSLGFLGLWDGMDSAI